MIKGIININVLINAPDRNSYSDKIDEHHGFINFVNYVTKSNNVGSGSS